LSFPPKVTVGILAYTGAKYFDFLFPALFAQIYPNLEILVLDNASPEQDAEILQKNFGEKIQVFKSAENLGFAGGHNFLIQRMSGEYYLCLNQDILLEPNFIAELVTACEKDERIGAATGKLRRWDFSQGLQGKTDLLDTTGIAAFATHRFIDRGQGEKDTGQYETAEEIFAASAAAALYRKSALEEVAVTNANGEKDYFDEQFFMYKEDIDLGYRLRWLGWKCEYIPQAVGYHDRTVAQQKPGIFALFSERGTKSQQVRFFSWRNHQLLLKKNYSQKFPWRIKFFTFWYQVFTHVYMLIFEPRILFRSSKLEYTAVPKKVAPEKIAVFFQ